MQQSGTPVRKRIAIVNVLCCALLGASTAMAGVSSRTLAVIKTGGGTGAVSSVSPGINCGATCSAQFADGVIVTLVAFADPGSQFIGWLGFQACTAPGNCHVTMSQDQTIEAVFAPASMGAPKLDIDASSECEATSDGLIALRYMFGFSGASLIAGTANPDATRTAANDIAAYLANIKPALDIDGDGRADALTDGLLIVRYMLGLRDSALVAGVVAPNPFYFPSQMQANLQSLCQVSIYVATTGDDTNPGTRSQPKRTVSAGIGLATGVGATTVKIASGTYNEINGVTLASGINLIGGFDGTTWLPNNVNTIITNTSGTIPSEGENVTVLAKNLAAPVRLSRLFVHGTNTTSPGKGSYGIVAISSNLVVDNTTIQPGAGAAGADGADGISASPVAATANMKGADGGASQTLLTCDSSSRGAGGPAGTGGAADGGAGGPGGLADANCFAFMFNATAGSTGANAPGAVTPDGQGGPGGPANSATPGSSGTAGRVQNGAGGIGGSAILIAGNYVLMQSGGSGGVGQAGGGGGGGGGSGGNDLIPNAYGAGGGGGGAGGAPAPGAAGGGGGGGASIGIWSLNSTVSVSNTTINPASPGQGGKGGTGGQGQTGGAGGAGGAASTNAKAGGAGGPGAHGGHGGGGGGGAGGFGTCIVSHGGDPTLTAVNCSGGVGVAGGAGGQSAPGAPVQDGNNGEPGAITAVVQFMSI